MKRFNFLIIAAISTMWFSGLATASAPDQGHNSTRSNRGPIAAPADTDGAIVKRPVAEIQAVTQPVKGRNPQTGKERNLAEEQKKGKGRNPQTGKEINMAPKEKGRKGHDPKTAKEISAEKFD